MERITVLRMLRYKLTFLEITMNGLKQKKPDCANNQTNEKIFVLSLYTISQDLYRGSEEMELHPTDKDFIEYVKEEYDPLPDTVKNYLSNVALKYMTGILIELESCDSPIEYLLGIALHKLFPNTIGMMTNDFFINSQETIECGEKKYRVDFFIAIRYKEVNYGFVVECDGHEFHEKTKEQAKKDKKRDRGLMARGTPVIRFTGSEIVESPDKCAREVLEIINKHLKR